MKHVLCAVPANTAQEDALALTILYVECVSINVLLENKNLVAVTTESKIPNVVIVHQVLQKNI